MRYSEGVTVLYCMEVEMNYTDAQIESLLAAVARGKREIAEDIEAGRVSATVASFSELHDYVDANEYGGLCDDDWDRDADLGNVIANAVQTTLDAWIKAGRPAFYRVVATQEP